MVPCGTHKSSIFIGFSLLNHPLLGTSQEIVGPFSGFTAADARLLAMISATFVVKRDHQRSHGKLRSIAHHENHYVYIEPVYLVRMMIETY